MGFKSLLLREKREPERLSFFAEKAVGHCPRAPEARLRRPADRADRRRDAAAGTIQRAAKPRVGRVRLASEPSLLLAELLMQLNRMLYYIIGSNLHSVKLNAVDY